MREPLGFAFLPSAAARSRGQAYKAARWYVRRAKKADEAAIARKTSGSAHSNDPLPPSGSRPVSASNHSALTRVSTSKAMPSDAVIASIQNRTGRFRRMAEAYGFRRGGCPAMDHRWQDAGHDR